MGKHSVHINDTQEETWRIATSVFNDNSIDLLNKRKFSETPNFDRFFSEYQSIIKNRPDNEDFCVAPKNSRSAYGLTDCQNIGFLHHFNINPLRDKINCYNDAGDFYNISKDEIIYNPNNHFYFNGFKFATLDIIKKMKLNRNEPKDQRDISLIHSIQ